LYLRPIFVTIAVCHGDDHQCKTCPEIPPPDSSQLRKKVEISDCNGFCLKDAYTKECNGIDTVTRITNIFIYI
jgi:hypothetical protein